MLPFFFGPIQRAARLAALVEFAISFSVPALSAQAIYYQDWQQAEFDPADWYADAVSGPTADPDIDGQKNLAEFVFIGDPLSTDDGALIAPQPAVIGDALTLTYRERHDLAGVQINLQGSSTLADWVTFNGEVEADRQSFTGYDEVTLVDPVSVGPGERRFLRLSLNLTQPEAVRAPTGGSFEVLSPSQWRVRWTDPNTEETGHAVERLRGLYSWEEVGAAGADQSNWVHDGANHQASFTYRVIAQGAGGAAAASEPFSLADSDGDLIPDVFEKGASFTGEVGTYPTYADQFSSNGSGVSDGWLADNGYDPMAPFDGALDSDDDGLSDAEEYVRGTDPHSPDTDGDGVNDAEDGWPLNDWITQPLLPEVSYAVVPLRALGWPIQAQAIELDDAAGVLGVSSESVIPQDRQGWYLRPATGDLVDVPVLYSALSERDDFIRSHSVNFDNDLLFTGYRQAFHSFWSLRNPFGKGLYKIMSPDGRVAGRIRNSDGANAAVWKYGQGVGHLAAHTEVLPAGDEVKIVWSTALAVNRHGAVAALEAGSSRRLVDNSYYEAFHYFGGLKYGQGQGGSGAWLGDVPKITTDEPTTDASGFVPAGINDAGVVVGTAYTQSHVYELDAFSLTIKEGAQSVEFPEVVPVAMGNGSPNVIIGANRLYSEGSWRSWLYKKNGTWVKEPLHVWNPVARSFVGPAATRINDRFELISGASIIRNGEVRQLAEFMPAGWTMPVGKDINNHGVILANARRTLDANGDPVADPQSEPVLLVPYYLVQADGEDAGKPITSGVSVYTPSDGAGAGKPIYHEPTVNIVVSFASMPSAAQIDTIECVMWGESMSLVETGPASMIFESIDANVSLVVSESPLIDSGVLESVEVAITSVEHGLDGAVYRLDETSAQSGVFEDTAIAVAIQIATLNPAAPDTVLLSMRTVMRSVMLTLGETSNDSQLFTDGINNVQLASVDGGSAQVGAIGVRAIITSPVGGMNNTRMTLPLSAEETDFYRNYPTPTPTDVGSSTPPDFAKWKLRIGIPPELAQALGLAWETDESERDIELESIPDLEGFYQSLASYITVPEQVNQNMIDGAQTLRIPAGALNWTSSVAPLALLLKSTNDKASKENVRPGGVALESLSLYGLGWFMGIDTEDRVKVPFEKLGYAMILDEDATTAKTLSEYAVGKQIWYSLSHGVTATGSPYDEFAGLSFKDAETAGSITRAKLQPLNLNYRLVIVDGCMSAQTSTASYTEALQGNTLTNGARNFAAAFGPNAAYMGWGWETNPGTAQALTAKMIESIKGRKTIKESYEAYLEANLGGNPGASLLKLYGQQGNRIDLSVK